MEEIERAVPFKTDEILRIFAIELRRIIGKLELDWEQVQEIRMRVEQPLMLIYQNEIYYITQHGKLVQEYEKAYLIQKKDINETMEYISNYSLYAFEEELKQGFITVQGGHRIGITGKVVLEGNLVKTIKYISCLNIRVAHQIRGCAKRLFSYLLDQSTGLIYHTVILSPPGCGKTTMLRDLIAQCSYYGTQVESHKKMAIGVVDERSEIAACYRGIPQNNLGIAVDVLDCCPKVVGMMMLIRSMAPSILAVDEIGSDMDIEAVEYAMHSGCKILTTAHAESIENISEKLQFERYVILSNRCGPGTVEKILDGHQQLLFEEKKGKAV